MTDLYGEMMGVSQTKKKKKKWGFEALTQNKIKYQIVLSNKSLIKRGLLSIPGLVESKWEICLQGVRPSQEGNKA